MTEQPKLEEVAHHLTRLSGFSFELSEPAWLARYRASHRFSAQIAAKACSDPWTGPVPGGNMIVAARFRTGGSRMDPNEAMGFFPERHVLRARRLRTMGDVPLHPSDALTRRTATWTNASVAVFTPIFAIAVIFGWISLKASLEIALCAGSCVLVCAILLGALSLRRVCRARLAEMDG